MLQPQSGSLEVVRIIVKYDPADINAWDEAGWTPLFGASGGRYFKDGSVVLSLLEHGADIHARSRGGWTPPVALGLAAENGYDESREINGRSWSQVVDFFFLYTRYKAVCAWHIIHK